MQKLRINCGTDLFGPGWRANVTIGYALRLTLVDVGGAGGQSMFLPTAGTQSLSVSKIIE